LDAVTQRKERREMGRKLGLDRVLDCFSLSLCANACACVHSVEKDEDEADERKALVSSQLEELVKLRDFVDGAAKTLAFHLEPKVSEQKHPLLSALSLSDWRLCRAC